MLFFYQLIYSRFFDGKSTVDSCTMFSDRNLINRRNVTGDVQSSYRPDRDFLWIVFQSRVITAAKHVLGIENKSGCPTKFKLPSSMNLLTKSEKLDLLHELAEKVIDTFVFEQCSSVDAIVDTVLTEQDKETLLNQQQLTPDGRFPCRFPGCKKSFKYDGKSRRKHELNHDPPFNWRSSNLLKYPCLTLMSPQWRIPQKAKSLQLKKSNLMSHLKMKRKQVMMFSITTLHSCLTVSCFLIFWML